MPTRKRSRTLGHRTETKTATLTAAGTEIVIAGEQAGTQDQTRTALPTIIQIEELKATTTAIEEGDTVIGFIVAGLVIGVLARLFKPGKQNLSLLMTLLLGLAGSVIGGVIANLLGTGDIWELNVIGFVVAVIAAVLRIGVFEGLSSKKSHT